MDTSDFDDMLFGEHDVQDAPEDTEEEDLEDEFLFATSQRENIPWDVCNNSNSTSLANGNALSIQETPQYHRQEHTLRPIRDRFSRYSHSERVMTNSVQTLGDRSHRSDDRVDCGCSARGSRSAHYHAEVPCDFVSQTICHSRRSRTSSRTEGTRYQFSRSKCARGMELQCVNPIMYTY